MFTERCYWIHGEVLLCTQAGVIEYRGQGYRVHRPVLLCSQTSVTGRCYSVHRMVLSCTRGGVVTQAGVIVFTGRCYWIRMEVLF